MAGVDGHFPVEPDCDRVVRLVTQSPEVGDVEVHRVECEQPSGLGCEQSVRPDVLGDLTVVAVGLSAGIATHRGNEVFCSPHGADGIACPQASVGIHCPER